jgi:hypothetical protein
MALPDAAIAVMDAPSAHMLACTGVEPPATCDKITKQQQ